MENSLGHPAVDIQVVEAVVVSPHNFLAVDPSIPFLGIPKMPVPGLLLQRLEYMFNNFRMRTLTCKELNLLLCALFLASLFGK